MSLLVTASPWINDETTIISKKRPSTMRKQIKSNDIDFIKNVNDVNNVENMQNNEPTTIEDSQTVNENRNNKINDLLNKMSFVSQDNDGSKMANFNPPPTPILNNKKPDIGRTDIMELKPNELLPKNPYQQNPQVFNDYKNPPSGNIQYKANEGNLGIYNNYKNSYESSNIQLKPYYSKMGISDSTATTDNKIMEKINYMIHMLEEQQNEKTNSTTEEFILYTFLGVFMIFIVDSFTRAGKYIR